MARFFLPITRIFLIALAFAMMLRPAVAAELAGAGALADARLDEVRGVILRDLEPGEKISADEVRSRQLKNEKFYVLDARSGDAYESAHVAGSILPLPPEFYRQRKLFVQQLIPASPDPDRYFVEEFSKYPVNTSFVTYCEIDCKASARLLLKLKKFGFKFIGPASGKLACGDSGTGRLEKIEEIFLQVMKEK